MDDSSIPPKAFFDGLREGSPISWGIVALLLTVVVGSMAYKYFKDKRINR